MDLWANQFEPPISPLPTLGTPQAFDCVPCPGSGDLSGTGSIFAREWRWEVGSGVVEVLN